VLGVAAFRTREPYTLIALVALKPSNGDGLDADKIAAVGAGLAARPSIWMRAIPTENVSACSAWPLTRPPFRRRATFSAPEFYRGRLSMEPALTDIPDASQWPHSETD
jgi:hypothetical protein